MNLKKPCTSSIFLIVMLTKNIPDSLISVLIFVNVIAMKVNNEN